MGASAAARDRALVMVCREQQDRHRLCHVLTGKPSLEELCAQELPALPREGAVTAQVEVTGQWQGCTTPWAVKPKAGCTPKPAVHSSVPSYRSYQERQRA